MQDVTVTGARVGTIPSDVYRLGTVMYVGSTYPVEIDEVRHNEVLDLEKSPLTRATLTRPYYIRLTKSTIELYPSTLASSSSVRCNYVDKPIKASWAYTVVNGEALYNSTSAVDFELHDSEETELVLKILELSGISIEDPQLYQLAAQEEGKRLQQEKI